MRAIIYLSANRFDMAKLMQVMQKQKILCNVEPLQSVVKDHDDVFRVESGAKVCMFDITAQQTLQLWFALRYTLKIHCIWMDCATYSGCICNWHKYKIYCEKTGAHRLSCSEYCDCDA